jgi:hypoxanthine phosphoribosyltransferase
LQTSLVFSESQIADAVRRLAGDITADHAGEDLLLVVVLKGAFVFAADLVRQLMLPVEIEFVQLRSYCGTETTGSVDLVKDVGVSITGRNVLIVEDIVDTGTTLAFLQDTLRNRKPKSLKVCSLLDKPSRRRVPVGVDYVGMSCGEGFLIGYGLDVNGRKRELPAIYEVKTGGLNDSPM